MEFDEVADVARKINPVNLPNDYGDYLTSRRLEQSKGIVYNNCLDPRNEVMYIVMQHEYVNTEKLKLGYDVVSR